MNLSVLLPQDRIQAIANNLSLPDRANGTVMFADISGFTALTESLIQSKGKRRGTESLSSRLASVYTALIKQVEMTGGSVVGFAGDAISCWWAGTDSALQATAAAFQMQRAIQEFPELNLKAGLASGSVRRFVVGDSEIQQLDLLAGETVARASTAENLAKAGQVLADEATLKVLVNDVKVSRVQNNSELVEKFGRVTNLSISPPAVEVSPAPELDEALLKGWLHRDVAGTTSELLQTELRPCTALFIKFTGINFETEDAGRQLQSFVVATQRSTERHGGILLDIVIGDKGSYAYVNFGALSAHEDDSRRAVNTALEIRNKTELQLQMGITQGLMRVGAYGGEMRRTFGALGDDVNLAARLMTTAKEGEILLSSHVHKAVRDDFTFEPRPPLPMKGKAEPLPVFVVTGKSQKRAVRLQEPNYSLPMVGRQEELKVINDKLDLAAGAKGQVIGVTAEAGLGKSRLVAEVIRNARRRGFVGFGGACQSDGIHTPYLAWKLIWQAFFDVDPEMPVRKQMRLIEDEIEDRAPIRGKAMPLLKAVLDLNIPENDFTQHLEPKDRQSALHALLEDCLKAQVKDEPTLIVIEDMHWIDALSHDLLDGLAKALANHAVCFVLAYRPPQLERLQAPRLETLPQFTRIELCELSITEAESAIRAKLVQLYPAWSGALPEGLVDALMDRAQGNPFYLEELLNYIRDRGLNPTDVDQIKLPDSLHTLILSRIDQLSEREQITLRVASIVGRLFRAKWLTGYHPELGSFPQVKVALDALELLDITPLNSPEPELAYLFKHIITHEVTYESLPFATRAKLHEQLARYLESIVEATRELPLLDVITYHYLHSENKEKQREYLRKAGESAQKNFANDAALEYYSMLLPLLKGTTKQAEIHLKRGEVLELTGKWKEANEDYHAALDFAEDHLMLKASALFTLGKLCSQRGDYVAALDWLAQVEEARMVLEDTAGLAQMLIEKGRIFIRKGEHKQALEPLNEGLALARESGDKLSTAQALFSLGGANGYQGEVSTAIALYEESLALRREIGDRQAIAISLNGLGAAAKFQGNYAAARKLYEEGLALRREIGDKHGVSVSLGSLGEIALAQGDYDLTRTLYEESLALEREMGNMSGISGLLNDLGYVALVQGDTAAARKLFEESLELDMHMEDKTGMGFNILGFGLVDLTEGKPEARKHILHSLRLRRELGEQIGYPSCLIGVAGLVFHEGNPKFAAQLLGAVVSALKVFHMAIEPQMKNFYAHTLEAVSDALGEKAFQSAWEEGAKWTLEEAVKLALCD